MKKYKARIKKKTEEFEKIKEEENRSSNVLDKNIAKARNICEKIGATPGTDKFIDCTIKMMSTSSGQQTVIVGQRKRTSIYPLHCRQMGGASNC